MLFRDLQEFRDATGHAITAFGMSGVGKTRLAATLRGDDWFHFSVDYRIGTRHMGEYIVDNFKAHAMKVPFLRDLLISDSIHISSNITFDNLEPLSTYIGTPGDPERDGLPFREYQRRQEQHRIAEISALTDIPYFIDRAKALYGYANFIADTGGSLIEVIDPANPDDPVLNALTSHTALLYIRGTETDADELIRRFKKAPKPMYYRPEFLEKKWQQYRTANGAKSDTEVDPAGFAAWGFAELIHDRLPRYQALADQFGYTVEASDAATVRDGKDFIALMSKAICARKGM